MSPSTDIYINHIGYALGSNACRVDDSAKNGRVFSELSALTEAGFEFHHIAGEAQSVADLAADAINNMLHPADSRKDRLAAIDILLFATCLPQNGNLGSSSQYESTRDVKHLMDFPASHIQAELGMSNASVMGINQQACTSLLGSIRVANALLRSESDLQNVLCVTADRFPPGAKYEQGYNLISDGAAACVLSRRRSGFRVVGSHHITNGAMAQASDEETAGFYFNYTHRLITEALKKCGRAIGDINWIVSQNTNPKAWRILSSLLGFDFRQVVAPTMGKIGHCISGDNLINLKVLANEQRLKSGDVLLLPMAGFGLNWSCVILEKVD